MPASVEIPVGPVSVRLLSAYDGVVTHFLSDGFEPESLEVWAELCRDGGTVVDGGAYTGIYSISAALMGCHVIAFEPMAPAYARLVANAALNEVVIDARREALAADRGISALFYNTRPALTSGASLRRRFDGRVQVMTMPLDDCACDPVAIKLDVERGEVGALRGARVTLQRARPTLLVEALGTAEMARLLPVAHWLGYGLTRRLDRRNLLLHPRSVC